LFKIIIEMLCMSSGSLRSILHSATRHL